MLNFIGGLVGLGGSILGGNRQAKAMDRASERAAESARLGFDYLRNDPTIAGFQQGGGNAFQTRQALLGLGGDEGAARQAFDNYLDSTGFNFALDTGRDAITGSRAARGLLDSGATAEGLTEFGNNLGRQAFGNYLGELNSDAQMGFNASAAIGGAGSGAGGQIANIQQRAGQDRAGVIGDTFGGVGEALGGMLGSDAEPGPLGNWLGRFF